MLYPLVDSAALGSMLGGGSMVCLFSLETTFAHDTFMFLVRDLQLAIQTPTISPRRAPMDALHIHYLRRYSLWTTRFARFSEVTRFILWPSTVWSTSTFTLQIDTDTFTTTSINEAS